MCVWRGGGSLEIPLWGKVGVVTSWPEIKNQRSEVRESRRMKVRFFGGKNSTMEPGSYQKPSYWAWCLRGCAELVGLIDVCQLGSVVSMTLGSFFHLIKWWLILSKAGRILSKGDSQQTSGMVTSNIRPKSEKDTKNWYQELALLFQHGSGQNAAGCLKEQALNPSCS